ncbi:hypothetical protein VCUG_02357 [Vavraia culicis subsp. floridensis]|uniref:Uncharacterized protein n=1 Tax=Vavraia culicis (isolate floridensis) TaxID=948595 RepID=L2GSS9_VAVCU|nr:uncharacterized protein VCUG_02357 [Vavraia culicis subsp. floridensis]ELA46155.1 hypothetical protein VCUG_02357 [Vavraia culicis subsp. floridensis]
MQHNFSRDTRFKQLPENIKKRLITLYNKTKQRKDIKTEDLDTSIFSTLSTKLTGVHSYELTKNYGLLVDAGEYYRECRDKNCKMDGADGQREIEDMCRIYNESVNGRDVLGEMIECVCLMSGKFLELKRNRKRNV